jgi:hypothetical protein
MLACSGSHLSSASRAAVTPPAVGRQRSETFDGCAVKARVGLTFD